MLKRPEPPLRKFQPYAVIKTHERALRSIVAKPELSESSPLPVLGQFDLVLYQGTTRADRAANKDERALALEDHFSN
jgi:hypothetical protein